MVVKSEAPIGWRRKSSPSPVTGSNSRRIALCRAAGERVYSTAADESVIEPPKPVEAVTVEATETAQAGWGRHMTDCSMVTLHRLGNTWYTGANVPGKALGVMPYTGGVGPYRKRAEDAGPRASKARPAEGVGHG